jgi:endonuclease/exonuclease/phosphatase family metal-dependent hydrolase
LAAVTLRLLSYNIRYGGVGHEDSLAEVLRAAAADVVLLQEATDTRVIERLAREAGYEAWGCQPRMSTGFLSRIPVEEHAWHRPAAARHAFLELVLAGGAPRVFVLHLSAWFSKWSEARRTREIQALLLSIKQHQDGFHLIAGDFNALAPGARLDVGRFPHWIRAMVWLSGRDIARSTIQVMLDARYVDAWSQAHPDDPGYTFPVWDPHVRLDYVFAPARDAARLLTCEIFTAPAAARAASDHFPLLVEVDAA